MPPRSIALLSLGLLAAYVGVVGVSGEPFPLGGSASDTSRVGQAVAVVLGLALGWALPGLSLAALTNPALSGLDRLPRAFGLGTAYLIAAGVIHALVMGHAPGRVTWLVLLALPPLVLVVRVIRRPATAQASAETARRAWAPVVAPLVAMLAVTMMAWPLVFAEGMNGDGTEAYELVRSLDEHRLPYWDLDNPEAPGRFGTPVTVPYLTNGTSTLGVARPRHSASAPSSADRCRSHSQTAAASRTLSNSSLMSAPAQYRAGGLQRPHAGRLPCLGVR